MVAVSTHRKLFIKSLCFLVGLINIGLSGYTQVIQHGIIRELNSNGKPVSGVGIVVLSATDLQPAVSNSNGTFRLVFSAKKAGERIYTIKITKNDYEIVNFKDFDKGWILSPYDTMKIIIAPKGMVDNLRRHYYDLLDQFQAREYTRTIAQLKQQLAEQRITAEEYRTKAETAEQELRNAYDKLEQYADLFARINKDDLDTMSRQALCFLEQGKINDAIAVYESHQLLEQLKQKVILRNQSNESIQNLIPKLQEEASYRLIVSGSNNLAKVDDILKNIAGADTSNFKYAYNYALFLTDQENLPKAVVWCQKAVAHANSFDEEIDALQNLGHIYYKQNQPEACEKTLSQAIQETEAIKESQPEAYHRMISYPLNTLANLYLDAGHYEKAEAMLSQCVAIRKDLAQANPEYLADYATALNNFGETYRMMYLAPSDSLYFTKSVQNYDAAIQIRKELCKNYNSEMRYLLANVLNNKGVVFMNADLLDSAIVCFQQANSILDSIVDKNPALYGRYLISTINNIGLLFSKKQQFDYAEQYFDRGLALCRQHETQNPELYLYYQSTLLMNKGLLYRRQKEFDQAKPLYLQALTLRKELAGEDLNCNIGIFEAENNIGTMYYYSKQYDSAVIHLNLALGNIECLMPQSPNQYIKHAANLSYTIAYLYYLQKDVKNGLPAYKKTKKICQQANKLVPHHYDTQLADIQKESKILKNLKRHS